LCVRSVAGADAEAEAYALPGQRAQAGAAGDVAVALADEAASAAQRVVPRIADGTVVPVVDEKGVGIRPGAAAGAILEHAAIEALRVEIVEGKGMIEV